MNLRTNCPKCGLDKLSHQSKEGKAISFKCRKCGFAKVFSKPKAPRYIKDQDYE